MTKNEQKYINSLKEENERVKTILMRFVDALGKLTNLDDVVNISLIPLMTEQNKKFREEIKSEAYKEFAERLKEDAAYYSNSDGAEWFSVDVADIDNILKELVIKNDIGRYDSYTDTFVKEMVGDSNAKEKE